MILLWLGGALATRKLQLQGCAAGFRVRIVRSMKNYLTIPLLASSLLFAGCGKKEESTAASASAPAAAAAVATFEVTANDSMKFNLTRLEVNAGQQVKLPLTNLGSMPKA